MVDTHDKALEFARDVVRFVGTVSVTVGNVSAISKRDRPACPRCMRINPNARGCGTFQFDNVREPTVDEYGNPEVGNHRASCHYTLPFEPANMRKNVILQLAPSSARYL